MGRRLFASYLGIPHVENMSRTTRVITEYDYLNVMFCREQVCAVECELYQEKYLPSIFCRPR